MKASWNTGRLYTQFGQRIAARVVDNKMYFVDVSRGIYGWFAMDEFTDVSSPEALRREVMSAYDNNRTQWMGMDSNIIHELTDEALAVKGVQ